MDIQMPEMNGLQATAAIRKEEEATGMHVPIIAMTAHAMEGDRRGALPPAWMAIFPSPFRRMNSL